MKVYLALLLFCVVASAAASSYGDYKWFSFDDGLDEAKRVGKPAMLVFHKTWCGSSQAMAPKFAESKAIKNLAKNFVMIDVVDEDEPKEREFHPDGKYYPRIMFVDGKTGDVRKNIINTDGHAGYKYYYGDVSKIPGAMRKVLDEEYIPPKNKKARKPRVRKHPLARGFGDAYDWKSFKEGVALAKETGKPGLAVFHKASCGACKAVGPKFAENQEVISLSENFVMINVADNEYPMDAEEWNPDGGYVPRMIFVNPKTGKPMKEHFCEGCQFADKHKYYYMSPEEIAEAMVRVIGGSGEGGKKVKRDSSALARGFGEQYEWHTLDDGLAAAKEAGKPAMLVFHKSWCGTSKSFGPKFAKSKEIEKAAKDFVLINIQDKDDPKDAKYSPDGEYIPRIMFTESDGTVRQDLINEGGSFVDQYKYYYTNAKDVVKAMARAKKAISRRRDEL